LATHSIDVDQAGHTQGLAHVDFERADLDHNGKIEGADEANALFTELDSVDHSNTDPDTIDISPETGAEPRKLVDAVARIARAEDLRQLAGDNTKMEVWSAPRKAGVGTDDRVRRNEVRVWRPEDGPTEIEAGNRGNRIKIYKDGEDYRVDVNDVSVRI